MDTGEIIPLTQRERDIDNILRYFYTNCGQEVLDVHSLTHTVTEQFPSIIIAMYHFLRKCSLQGLELPALLIANPALGC